MLTNEERTKMVLVGLVFGFLVLAVGWGLYDIKRDQWIKEDFDRATEIFELEKDECVIYAQILNGRILMNHNTGGITQEDVREYNDKIKKNEKRLKKAFADYREAQRIYQGED